MILNKITDKRGFIVKSFDSLTATSVPANGYKAVTIDTYSVPTGYYAAAVLAYGSGNADVAAFGFNGRLGLVACRNVTNTAQNVTPSLKVLFIPAGDFEEYTV